MMETVIEARVFEGLFDQITTMDSLTRWDYECRTIIKRSV
jgi:hypothetical protein